MMDPRATDVITDGLLLSGVVLLCTGLLFVITILLPPTADPSPDRAPSSPVTTSR